MIRFDQLDAYRVAIEYVGMTRALVLRLRKTDVALADQLHRAVLSIPCNVAEGAGEFSPGDKARFYRYALRSTAETVALLDCCRKSKLSPAAEHEECVATGMRLVAMLTRLVLSTVPGTPPRRRTARKPPPPPASGTDREGHRP